jgi:cytoskeletal protein CcmA (bactofilin family)
MLNFNRRDRPADAAEGGKVLKPAIYASPSAAANPAPIPPPRAAAPPPGPAAAPLGSPLPAAMAASGVIPSTATPPAGAGPGSRLVVGVNIKLKSSEISDCDALVIEGHVEATVLSKLMEIAMPGTLKGTALVDVAEVHGEFAGELTARARLIVHGTGRVSGVIRYGQLIVAEGGEVSGDVKRLDGAQAQPPAPAARAGSPAVRPDPAGERLPH